MFYTVAVLGILLVLAKSSLQAENPVSDFCRRFGHQTTVIDRKLYIDGGLLNWNSMAQYPANYTSKSHHLSIPDQDFLHFNG